MAEFAYNGTNGTSAAEILPRSPGLIAQLFAPTFAALPLPGLLLNLLVIYMSVKKGVIEGNFKWFMCNTAIIDTIFCLSCMPQAYFMTNRDYTGFACTIVGFFFFYSYISPIVCLVPVTISRAVGIYFWYWHPVIFTRRNIFLFIAFFDFLPALLIAPFGFQIMGYFGRSSGQPFCQFMPFLTERNIAILPTMHLILVSGSRIVSFLVVFGTCSAIMLKMWRHQRVVESLQNHQRMKETRQIIWATLAQALYPILSQLPTLVINVTITSGVFGKGTTSSGVTRLLGNALFLLNPLADATATLLVVKPYRSAIRAWFKGLLKKDARQSEEIEPASMVKFIAMKTNTAASKKQPADMPCAFAEEEDSCP